MDLSDYGLSGFHDPGLDLLSTTEVRSWYRRQWTGIAAALGFSQSLERQYATSSTVNLAGENQTALNAFTAALACCDACATGHACDGSKDARQQVQSAVLASVLARGRQRGELWRTVDDVATLPSGACYPAAGGELQRAFFPDTAPGYFGDGWPGPPPRAESACGWETPLVLHLGTFPWIYSGRLDGAGPGLRWALEPARLGLGVVASLLDPETNLRQDARQVATICRTFGSHTLALLRNLPVMPAPGTWSPTPAPRLRVGQVFVRDGEVLVHQGSLHLAGLDGPRGRLSVLAYNYCVARFAAFFALRSAALRALPTLSRAVQQFAVSSPDPVLRHYAEQAMRR
jgi:hypothetical protein